MLFLVITAIGNPRDNCYDTLAFLDKDGTWNTAIGATDSNITHGLEVRVPVFEVGEILIMPDERFYNKHTHFGREIAGRGRKPSGFAVEYEVFETVEEAVVRAHKAQNDEIDKQTSD